MQPPAGQQAAPPATPPAAAPPATTVPATTVPPTTVPPQAAPPTPPGAAAAPAAVAPAATAAPAQIVVTPPGSEWRVGGGPFTLPVTVADISRASTVSLSISFNPQTVRVRSVQEGSFMRQGGAQVAFAQQVDGASGRVDLTLSRTGDTVGASGSGLLAAVIFEAVAPGSVTFTPSGVASGPGGGVALQFVPATVTVK
jgi:general secretion pathway protein D